MRESLRNWNLTVYPDLQAIEHAAADEVVRTVRNAIARRGVCAWALAGGSTPRGLYQRLAEDPWRERLDWKRLHFFWTDERCVPPEHPQSNYRMAWEALLSRIPVSPGNIHRIQGERPPAEAAALYQRQLKRWGKGSLPRFDFVLLGMGADGHTASLLPGTEALSEKRRLVLPTLSPRPPRERVSLSLRAINAARKVLFLVAGEEKAVALEHVINEPSANSLPASLVRPAKGTLLWLVDRAAAARLISAQSSLGALSV